MDPLRLPESWTRLDEKHAARLSKELTRELPAGHPLYGETCTAIAIRQRTDDVLFRRPVGSYVLVHLTWNIETDPTWPWIRLIPSQAELIQANDAES